MKKKCPICKMGKARRECPLKDGMMICSRCCAEMRGTECGECPHYEEAMLNAMRRGDGLPEGHFIAEINPELEESVFELLDQAMAGETSKAFREMERLVAENPRNHDVCYGMGSLFAISGREADAIPWLEKAVSIFPYMAQAYYNLGIAYMNTYNIGRMVTALRKAVEYGDPEEEYYREACSQLKHAEGVIARNEGVGLDDYVASSEKFEAAFEEMEKQNWEAALAGFQAAAAYNEKNAPTHGNMGMCLAQLGRRAEALAALDHALEVDPGYEPAVGNRLLVERMEEGAPLEGVGFQSVNFAEEQLKKERRTDRQR